jgi:hypothetical protein
MAFDEKTARFFGLNENGWERHANPWSVWTRFTVLPILVSAIWSRVWFAEWSLILIAAAIAWMWINPRLFPSPRSTNNWASMGVMGERVWLKRNTILIPEHHRLIPHLINLGSVFGLIFLIWGLIDLDVPMTLLATVTVQISKLWFIDRMVWLYLETKDSNPEYASWLH